MLRPARLDHANITDPPGLRPLVAVSVNDVQLSVGARLHLLIPRHRNQEGGGGGVRRFSFRPETEAFPIRSAKRDNCGNHHSIFFFNGKGKKGVDRGRQREAVGGKATNFSNKFFSVTIDG